MMSVVALLLCMQSASAQDITTKQYKTCGSHFVVVEPGSVTGLYQALELANSKNSDERFCIFLPNGTYDMGSKALTQIAANNISIVGQSTDKTIIVNKPLKEGIGITATFLINKGVSGTYFQDLTLKNAIDYYGGLAKGEAAGRAVCLQDKGTNTICKNVKMLSYQDTYYSNNSSGNYYFETSEIHGTVDFICGGGQAYFNKCLIYVEGRKADGSGTCTITAPSTGNTKYGYVFNECTIDNHTEKFNLGRAWNDNPKCAWLNTTINMGHGTIIDTRYNTKGMNIAAKEFYEYNSVDGQGKRISPDSNILTFTHDKGDNADFETILTDRQAADFALEKVFTSWKPNEEAAQTSIASATISNSVISWTAAENATMYAIFKGDTLIGITAETSYPVSQASNDYTVRAANTMGGFGKAVAVK